MYNVKIISGLTDLAVQGEVNAWFKKNEEITLVDMLQSRNYDNYLTITIIWK